MRWRCDTWHVSSRVAQATLAALAAAGMPEATVSSRPGGGAELCVWGRGGRLPAAARGVLAALGEPAASAVHDEAALLAAHAPDGPVELAPGVIIDPGKRNRRGPGIRLHIPPAPAFGDGRHPTTRLVTRALLALDVRGLRVLDLGCGTGVLGLIAARRGAARVDFADIDPGSVRATRAACRLNGMLRPRVWQADLLDGVRGTGYDLLLGNLYADLCLLLLADPRLASVLPSGAIVLSGIAHRRRAAVERRLRDAGFRITHREQEAWWWCLVGRRSG